MSGAGQGPVFVYGTLRPGQPNWEELLAGRCERVVAGRLPGVVLLDYGHYPAAVERPGADGAVGEVVWITPGLWPAVLAALDRLEGYAPSRPDRLFDRVVRRVETADGPVDCWVYLAGRTLPGSGRPVVAHGDWVVHCGGTGTKSPVESRADPEVSREAPGPGFRPDEDGREVLTRWFPASVIIPAGPAVVIGFATGSAPYTVLVGLVFAARIWDVRGRPWRIAVHIDTGLVHIDMLPFRWFRRTFEARRLTYETKQKQIEIGVPTPVLRRRSLTVGRPGDNDLLAALDAAGAMDLTG